MTDVSADLERAHQLSQLLRAQIEQEREQLVFVREQLSRARVELGAARVELEAARDNIDRVQRESDVWKRRCAELRSFLSELHAERDSAVREAMLDAALLSLG